MTGWSFRSDALALPPGAFARTHREWLRRDARPVLALTQGPFRPYLFPLLTPAGHLVASESPADHPHHNGLWLGADHVHMLVPVGPGRSEEYTYNFYVDEVFQGRAPGRQVVTGCVGSTRDDGGFGLLLAIDWRGPAEWGAPNGRRVLAEQREIVVRAPSPGLQVLDVTSRLSAPGAPVRLGPTRHALFNLRVSETMTVANGGLIRDALGGRSGAGGTAAGGDGAGWVDFTGPVGGGAVAGMTLVSHPVPGRTPTWFVADWGVVTVGPFRQEGLMLGPGDGLSCGFTVIVHDGPIADAEIARIAAGRAAPAPQEDERP
ncbi:MAG: PmoA family protein [Rhodobacteraceae bacterium]|nr:PmoA family protein [Paracoccaceae bacterium]